VRKRVAIERLLDEYGLPRVARPAGSKS